MYVLTKIVGIALMISAFFTWITYDYPDINFLRLGILDIGLGGTIGMMINWVLVCIQGAVGWYLYRLKSKR